MTDIFFDQEFFSKVLPDRVSIEDIPILAFKTPFVGFTDYLDGIYPKGIVLWEEWIVLIDLFCLLHGVRDMKNRVNRVNIAKGLECEITVKALILIAHVTTKTFKHFSRDIQIVQVFGLTVSLE
jgi:hypothetical protein